jgi:hypothetical protein
MIVTARSDTCKAETGELEKPITKCKNIFVAKCSTQRQPDEVYHCGIAREA